MGFVTKDVPVGHPDFGKAFPCVCQRDILLARRSTRLQKLSSLSAVADKTFENFSLDLEGLNENQLSALRAAYQLAHDYAGAPHGWLLFEGSYGCGKTHLAAAIANYRLALGEQVLFVTVPDLLDHLRSTYAPSSEIEYDDLFEQIREAPLLVLDDLGAESSTAWAQEKLYQLINHRYLYQLNTVFTTNCDLNDLDPRIRSRLLDWHLAQTVPMRLPDFRRPDPTREQSVISNLNSYMGMTFDTFDMRRHGLPEKERHNLRDAYNVALEYAQKPHDWLMFIGEHGCGKTHLAAAIAHHRHQLGDSVMMVSAPDLLDYLRSAFNPSSTTPFDKRFYEIRSVQLLVIDQLDTSNATPWAREKLRQIAEHRYLNHAPTVFTTTQPLEELDAVLRSRLLDQRHCQIFAILAPDYMGGAVPRPPKRSNPAR